MQIANMLGTSTSSALEAVYGDTKKKGEESRATSPFATRDTVTLSAEALELAYRMKTAESQSAEGEENFPSGQDDDQDNGQKAAQAGGSGASFGSSDRSAEIEAKIKELQQKISAAQNSAMPEDSKEAVISGLQAQVDALMQELNALKSAA